MSLFLRRMIVDGELILNSSGSSLTGDLNADSNKIVNLPEPSDSGDATSRGWVLSQISGSTPSFGGPDAILAGQSTASGSASTSARSDHTHGVQVVTPENVGRNNHVGVSEDFVRGDHVHATPVIVVDKQTALIASGSEMLAVAIGLEYAVALYNAPSVIVNGKEEIVGDGVKTEACYYSYTSGSTASTFQDLGVAEGANLYWNADIAGYNLDTDCVIIQKYFAWAPPT